MGKVIHFPTKYRESEPGTAVNGDRYRQLIALRMVFDDIRSGRVTPEKLFLVYGTHDDDGLVWSYLSLGFEPDDLVKAIDYVLEDLAQNLD